MKDKLTKKDICCLIVSFNPDDILKRLVSIMRDQVDKVIIVDNNSVGGPLELLRDISEDEKVSLIQNFKNFGIAKALNQGVQVAIKMRFKAVITFDQDSLPCDNIIEIITEVYDSFPAKDRIGAIGINYCSGLSGGLLGKILKIVGKILWIISLKKIAFAPSIFIVAENMG